MYVYHKTDPPRKVRKTLLYICNSGYFEKISFLVAVLNGMVKCRYIFVVLYYSRKINSMHKFTHFNSIVFPVDFVDSTSSELCFRTIGSLKHVWVTAFSTVNFYEIRSSGPECTNVIFEEILFRYDNNIMLL